MPDKKKDFDTHRSEFVEVVVVTRKRFSFFLDYARKLFNVRSREDRERNTKMKTFRELAKESAVVDDFFADIVALKLRKEISEVTDDEVTANLSDELKGFMDYLDSYVAQNDYVLKNDFDLERHKLAFDHELDISEVTDSFIDNKRQEYVQRVARIEEYRKSLEKRGFNTQESPDQSLESIRKRANKLRKHYGL